MSTDDKLATLDLSDAAEKLRDKIKYSFAELIPDDQWEAMLRKEFDAFINTTERTLPYNRGKETVPSRLATMCREALEERAKEMIVLSLQNDWSILGDGLTENIERVLLENKDTLVLGLLRSTMGEAMKHVLQDVQSQMASQRVY